jgi:hypothetical protein|tara:strand:+ start:241 stop:429 length:189 start_codon:yes stop_codon:yes gene_type:complete
MSKDKQIDLLKDVKEIEGVKYIPLDTATAAIDLVTLKLDEVVNMVQKSLVNLDKGFRTEIND